MAMNAGLARKAALKRASRSVSAAVRSLTLRSKAWVSSSNSRSAFFAFRNITRHDDQLHAVAVQRRREQNLHREFLAVESPGHPLKPLRPVGQGALGADAGGKHA